MFKNIIIFTIIILIHELGHFIVGKLLNWETDKIYIYPYGGCTKFKSELNKPIKEEILILLSGPLIQVLFWIVVRNYLYSNTLHIFDKYNIGILAFNVLPIYVLDGGKLLNLILECFIPYKKSLYISIYISCIFIGILLFFDDSLVFYLVIFLLLIKTIDEYKLIKYYVNKFLMERYLKKYSFKKIKVIDSINLMMRDKKHVIKYNKKYETEKNVLNRKYKSM